jgi:NAD(P)H-flavin reductase
MPGQYIQVRVPGAEKTDYYPIASAPGADTMEVLLPSDLASHAELEISQVMPPASRNFGPGFRLFQLLSWKMEVIERVILFAEGDGIGAIRSVVESDLLSKSDVELFYGGEEGKMPYLAKVEEWKKRFAVNILPNTDLLKAATESGAAEKKGSRGATIAVGDHTTMFKFSKESELRALCKEVQIDETRISIFRL